MICDFFHPNNSQKPPIARLYGGGWGIFKFIVSITFYLLRCPFFQYHIVFERDISGVLNTGNQFHWFVRGRNSDFTLRLSYSIQLEPHALFGCMQRKHNLHDWKILENCLFCQLHDENSCHFIMNDTQKCIENAEIFYVYMWNTYT